MALVQVVALTDGRFDGVPRSVGELFSMDQEMALQLAQAPVAGIRLKDDSGDDPPPQPGVPMPEAPQPDTPDTQLDKPDAQPQPAAAPAPEAHDVQRTFPQPPTKRR